MMKLNEAPFNEMAAGKKTVEVRLNDPKRQQVAVGDFIEFKKLPALHEKVVVEVVSLEVFNTFKGMYHAIPAHRLGEKDKSVAEMVEATYEIYSPSQERQWGTLAIGVKVWNGEDLIGKESSN